MVIKYGRLNGGAKSEYFSRESKSNTKKSEREKIEWKKMNTRWIKIDQIRT